MTTVPPTWFTAYTHRHFSISLPVSNPTHDTSIQTASAQAATLRQNPATPDTSLFQRTATHVACTIVEHAQTQFDSATQTFISERQKALEAATAIVQLSEKTPENYIEPPEHSQTLDTTSATCKLANNQRQHAAAVATIALERLTQILQRTPDQHPHNSFIALPSTPPISITIDSLEMLHTLNLFRLTHIQTTTLGRHRAPNIAPLPIIAKINFNLTPDTDRIPLTELLEQGPNNEVSQNYLDQHHATLTLEAIPSTKKASQPQ